MSVLLDVKNLSVSFQVGKGKIYPVRNMNIQIRKDEVVAVIGETGCGKSVFGNSILRLLPSNALVDGEVFLNGKDILRYSKEEYRKIRGREISAVPQSPVSSLDPMMRVGKQVEEALLVHEHPEKGEARNAVLKLFSRLHFRKGDEDYSRYPSQLSGGMCQRVLIALGIITHPQLIIVDEPTKGLDWALRGSVIDIFSQLKEEMECAMLLITHDIGVAYKLADRIAVMYCGQIVEIGDRETILFSPRHPYTKGLLDSMPSRGMHSMQGFSPALTQLPQGCKFHPRCESACERCRQEEPQLTGLSGEHQVRCFLADEKNWKREEHLPCC